MREKLAAWRGKRNKRKIAAACVVLVLVFAIGLSARTLGSPANGAVNNSANLEPNPQAAPAKPVTENGKYIKFSYMDDFRQSPTEKPSGVQLENFDYVTKHAPFWELAIGVSSLPSGNLSESGSYNLRNVELGRYKLERWTVGSSQIAVFSDATDGYSKVAFWPHNGKLLTLALSGSGDPQKMQTEQQRVLNSVEWQD